ncbi:hypothetical protein [Desulfurobacterium indicum]|uniref:Phosphatidate cytidylyltransferase n=1 Tax=Desulfurobacterium indicum TaxID=1914305 RepID=A0A1R1MKA3_9BACT|nr:hypothetical protein [Desulfurobacterium indicum]OMH40237.1 hypothetical protein BLW93_06415 [Desulfurobacterium indicum]
MQNKDKLYHFIIGILAFTVPGFFFSPQVGLIFAAILATAKEMYDARHSEHTSDANDLIATISGALFAFLLFFSG